MEYQVNKELYAPFKKDKALYEAMIAYEQHFHFPYPLNFVSDETIDEINQAIATNTEWELDTQGGKIIY